MKHGIIKLISNKDEILRSKQYWGIQERKDIIKEWSKQYGKRFNECSIHLIPEVNPWAVRENGKNMRYKKRKPTINGYDPTKKINPQKNHYVSEKLRSPTLGEFPRWNKV